MPADEIAPSLSALEKVDPIDPAVESLQQPSAAALEHGPLSPALEFGCRVYRDMLKRLNNRPEAAPRNESIARDLLRRFDARDPVEEMLASQMVWTHARCAMLNSWAMDQKNIKWSQQLHTAADRASHLLRKQAQALTDYRQPRRKSNFTAIRNATIGSANIAQQQVVNQQKDEDGK